MPKIAMQIRLDELTHERLKVIADKELRSLNAQMEYFIIKGIEQWEDSEAFNAVFPDPRYKGK
jgi:hypothetical protein